MASTYSDLKIELIGTGEQSGTWGATTNTNLGTALEEAIAGRANPNFTSDADLTISLTNTNATQIARHYILNVTSGVSLSTTRNLIVPTIDKPYIIENNTTGGQSIVVKTSAGTGVTVPNGKKTIVYANSTNVVSAIDYVPNLTIAAGVINGTTLGATTPSTGAFTTLSSTGNASLGDAEATDTHAIKGATTVLANSASAALTVTQTGAGNAFVVEDSTSPDATPFVINNSGNVIIGHTESQTALGSSTIQVNTTGLGSAYATANWNTLAAGSPAYFAYKSVSGTVGTFTGALPINSRLLSITAFGDNGTGFSEAARIRVETDAASSGAVMPSRFTFVLQDSAGTLTERMRIDSAGRVGIGSVSTDTTFNNSRNITGNVTSYANFTNSEIQSDVTTNAYGYRSRLSTQAAAFTLPLIYHYSATQGTFGASSTVTSQIGFNASSTLIGATNNYGFYSDIPSGTGRWNFYAVGTAANYFAGDTWFGSAAGSTGLKLNSSSSGIQNTIAGNAAAGGQLDLEMFTADGTSGTSIRLFRSTNTTGNVGLQINLGNGTNTANHVLYSNNNQVSAISSNNGSVELGNSAGYVQSKASFSAPYVAHAAGTTAMAFGTYNVVRVTPNATATYTTTVPRAGAIVVLSILTSGTTSYTITFGTGFKSTGTLATGTVSARYFNLTFVSDGTNLIETARTVAIA